MCHLTVVGEEHQTRGVLIQAAAGKQSGADTPQLLGKQIQHGLLAAVLGGADHAVRLVHHNIGVLPIGYKRTAKGDASHVRVDLLISSACRHAVHQHLTRTNGTGGLAACRHARKTQRFVKSHGTPPFLTIKIHLYMIPFFCKKVKRDEEKSPQISIDKRASDTRSEALDFFTFSKWRDCTK